MPFSDSISVHGEVAFSAEPSSMVSLHTVGWVGGRAEIDGGWIVCLVKTSKVRMLCTRMPSRQLPASLSVPLTLFN